MSHRRHDIKKDDPSHPIAVGEPSPIARLALGIIIPAVIFTVTIIFISISHFLALVATVCMLYIIAVIWTEAVSYYFWAKARTACEILQYDPNVRSEKQWLRHSHTRGQLEMNIANCDIENMAAGAVLDLFARMKQRRQIGRLIKQDVKAMLHSAREREQVAKVYEELAERVKTRSGSVSDRELEAELSELAGQIRAFSSAWDANLGLPPSYAEPQPPPYITATTNDGDDASPEVRT